MHIFNVLGIEMIRKNSYDYLHWWINYLDIRGWISKPYRTTYSRMSFRHSTMGVAFEIIAKYTDITRKSETSISNTCEFPL